jgi:hypothetical protein
MKDFAQVLAVIAGAAMVVTILRDAFEVIVLPRRLAGRIRIARAYYFVSWAACRSLALKLRSQQRRETVLSYYGPLWMISLVGIWAMLMIVAFGLIQWGLGSGEVLARGRPGFWNDIYISGTTLFTLGMGDIYPKTVPARLVAVLEAGVGLGFLALVIGYLPVLYSSFSKREVFISLFDSRAGSPPTAGALLTRYARFESPEALRLLLTEFERWSAEILESHLSYPVLAWYRSQHDRQSWLATISVILDTSAVLLAVKDGRYAAEAQFAFVIARHTVIDLEETLRAPEMPFEERLSEAHRAQFCNVLTKSGFEIGEREHFLGQLERLRASYEPSLRALSSHLVLPLPDWVPAPDAEDDWETGMHEHLSSEE